MKVAFLGPSLHGVPGPFPGLEIRPPAEQGDVLRAVEDGAVAVGLVDGYFGSTAAVWHKEILYALSLGVRVLGAASMGALRAAECHAFGMTPVGDIAQAYVDGTIIDDDAVALVHGPAEFDHQPFTEPLVDALPTIDRLEKERIVNDIIAALLRDRATRLHFSERTIEDICAVPGISPAREADLAAAYRAHKVFAKRRDALLLIEELATLPNKRAAPPATWTFLPSPLWQRLRNAA